MIIFKQIPKPGTPFFARSSVFIAQHDNLNSGRAVN